MCMMLDFLGAKLRPLDTFVRKFEDVENVATKYLSIVDEVDKRLKTRFDEQNQKFDDHSQKTNELQNVAKELQTSYSTKSSARPPSEGSTVAGSSCTSGFRSYLGAVANRIAGDRPNVNSKSFAKGIAHSFVRWGPELDSNGERPVILCGGFNRNIRRDVIFQKVRQWVQNFKQAAGAIADKDVVKAVDDAIFGFTDKNSDTFKVFGQFVGVAFIALPDTEVVKKVIAIWSALSKEERNIVGAEVWAVIDATPEMRSLRR